MRILDRMHMSIIVLVDLDGRNGRDRRGDVSGRGMGDMDVEGDAHPLEATTDEAQSFLMIPLLPSSGILQAPTTLVREVRQKSFHGRAALAFDLVEASPDVLQVRLMVVFRHRHRRRRGGDVQGGRRDDVGVMGEEDERECGQ